MSKYRINSIIIFILVIGLGLSGELVYSDYTFGDICPKIGLLPACYLVLTYFIILLVVHIYKTSNLIFFLFSGFALALAIFASIGQLLGKINCPKTSFGFPLCYVSFMIFSGLIYLKFLEEKLNNKV